MVSHNEPVDIVRQALTGRHEADADALTCAAVLAERLECVNRLGGLFEQITFSPQMEALFSVRQPAETARLAVV